METRFFEPIYDDCRDWVIPTVSIALYIATVICTVIAQRGGSDRFKTTMLIVAGAWAVIVPAAFSFEYYTIHLRPPTRLPSMEAFKYSQELAKNIWIAAVAFLTVLHTNILPKSLALSSPDPRTIDLATAQGETQTPDTPVPNQGNG